MQKEIGGEITHDIIREYLWKTLKSGQVVPGYVEAERLVLRQGSAEPRSLLSGVPFNNTEDIHIQIVEHGQQIIGSNLLGFQVGNEPDLYAQCADVLPTLSPVLLTF